MLGKGVSHPLAQNRVVVEWHCGEGDRLPRDKLLPAGGDPFSRYSSCITPLAQEHVLGGDIELPAADRAAKDYPGDGLP